ncbi:formin-like protein 5 [Arachis ipaensis]|uniref:formin-like protein 5 n=1 Tax=Arachis ipaensis TaxID=130454 RepID=UPI000A2B4823|nr:formin-like protein 5 [Arachis ipaensis]
MELTRPGYAVIYVILLCALAQGGSEGKRGEDDDFSPSSLLVHTTQQAEIVPKHRKELTKNIEAKELDLHAKEESNDIRPILFRENNTHKATKSNQTIDPPTPQPQSPPPRRSHRLVAASRSLTESSDPVTSPPPNKNEDDKQPKTTVHGAAAVSGILMALGVSFCYRQVKTNKEEKEDILILTSKDYAGGSPKIVRLGDNTELNKHNKEEESGTDNNEKKTSDDDAISGSIDNKNEVCTRPTTTTTTATISTPRLPGLGPRAPPPPPLRGGRGTSHPPPVPSRPLSKRFRNVARVDSFTEAPDPAKPKLKPFFWDKVNAKSDQAMVWHEISGGSFVFNEEQMEFLFGCTNHNKNERKKDSPQIDSAQLVQIIDKKKAQNLSILLKALNVTTEEVVDAIKEGNELPIELMQTLVKMAPTSDEELKLRLYTGPLSDLGPAEKFLKVLVDIPFAFRRIECLIFMCTLQEESSTMREYFTTLEVACKKLVKSRLFLKLLEAVLKTGNRMNDGTYRGGAQAFKLDTLLKLSDVKGTDGKTTLLHFVVQEIIRSEGVRALRTAKESGSMPNLETEDSSEENYRSLGIEVVSGLSAELLDVRMAALIDGDLISSTVAKLSHSLSKTREFLDTEMKNVQEDGEFRSCMEGFLEKATSEVAWLIEEEKRITELVKGTADYFHGNSGKEEGLRLFAVVRDFLFILDKVCKEVKETNIKEAKINAASKNYNNNNNNHNDNNNNNSNVKESSPSVTPSSTTEAQQQNSGPSELHRRLFPAIVQRRVDDDSSSDDDYDDDDDNNKISP